MNTLRFSLARMLGVVVLVALGLAALVNATRWWVSVAFSVALTVLFVGVVGGLCRTGARRAFWSGFAVFGLGYLVLAMPIVSASAYRYLVTTEFLQSVYPSVRRIQPPSSDGAMVVWFRSDGTVLFQGEPVALDQLETAIQDHLPKQSADPSIPFRQGSFRLREPSVQVAVYHDPDVDRTVALDAVALINSYRNVGLSNVTQTTFFPSQTDFVRLGHCLFTLLFACAGGILALYLYATRERAS